MIEVSLSELEIGLPFGGSVNSVGTFLVLTSLVCQGT